jgi:succinate dehydrogenase / fumarate reductase, flavoprotein subunit
VFGARAGAAAATHSREMTMQLRSRQEITRALDDLDGMIRDGDQVVRLCQRELRDTMWDHVGVVRDEAGLDEGLQRLRDLQEQLPDLDVAPDSQGYQDVAAALDLRGSVVTAMATAMAAKERRETRGAQQRSDHPERDDDHQLVNHRVRLDADGALTLETLPRPEIPAHLREWAQEAETVDTEGRLLE